MQTRPVIHAIILSFIVLLMLTVVPTAQANTPFTIWGTGYATPMGTHPLTTVNLYDKATMTLLGTTVTQPSGSYAIDFYPVGIRVNAGAGTEYARLLSNPYQDKMVIEIACAEKSTWLCTVVDEQGKTLLSQNLSLDQGTHLLSLSGMGAAGLKTINLKSISGRFSLKAIQSVATSLDPQLQVYKKSSELKSTPASDSLLVSFVPPSGYIGMDTTVAFQSQVVNYVLEQIPTIFDFTAYALTINGDTIKQGMPIDAVSIDVRWFSDGVTINYPAVNGVIYIHREEYAPNVSAMVDISNPDTSLVTEYTIGLKRDSLINTKEMNLFQNVKTPSGNWGSPYNPPGAATATLAILPDSFDIYFVPRLILAADGQYYNTKGEIFRFVARGNAPYSTRKYETMDSIADKIHLFEMQPLYLTGTYQQGPLITNQQRLDQKRVADSAQTLFFLNNGRQIFPKWDRPEIYDFTEPEWIQAQNRNWDQTHQYQYIDAGNPENAVATNMPGFGGITRIRTGYAHSLFGTLMGGRMEEAFQALCNAHDPPALTTLADYIYSDTSGLSEFGKTVFHFIYIVNPGTNPW
ncbi:MAG: hypothetical protein NT040_08120 [Bacteroidetes bacterium]|nr:hypothetical protein [Bacteroidota bacterium]